MDAVGDSKERGPCHSTNCLFFSLPGIQLGNEQVQTQSSGLAFRAGYGYFGGE